MEIERLKKEDEEAVKKEAEEELTKETSPVVTEPGNEGEGANNQAKK
jgi:hypothetical protein